MAVVADGSGFRLAWLDMRTDPGGDLYGARVSGSGGVLDVSGFPIATSTDDEGLPALVSAPSGGHRIVYQRRSTESPFGGLERIRWRAIGS